MRVRGSTIVVPLTLILETSALRLAKFLGRTLLFNSHTVKTEGTIKMVLNITVQSVQYSTVQYSAVQYSTVQCSAVQYSTVQYSAVQCS